MDSPSRFPWWVIAGAFLLAAGYLPSLNTPFDFTDDGNLVYPSPPTTITGHADIWWAKVKANYDHLGPFRPTLWVHWELQANLFGGDPFAWRLYRLLWSGFAAGMLLWLFRELGVHPVAALLAGALAMWNPYRNEIWTSLTLAEGVAMPYALLGLVAARKASRSPAPLKWELLSAFGVFVALGCKNTFAALVPAQIVLRMWPDGLTLREAWRANGRRSLALGVTLALPAAHFVYYKAHWHPGQYETHGPSLAQLGRILSSLKGAMSLDFMGAGLALAVVCLWLAKRKNLTPGPFPKREGEIDSCSPFPLREGGWGVRFFSAPLACALLLLAGGVVAYLPMSMVSGRYSMPAVWGLDILCALLLSALVAVPESAWRKAAWGAVAAGLAVVMIANVGRQEKFAARAKMLWDATRYVEANAPPNARVAWMSGDSLRGGLNVEEGIHVQWHLLARGRGDVKLGLFDESGRPLERVELPPLDGPPDYALYGAVVETPNKLEPERTFAAAYWLGRKRYDCHISRSPRPPFLAAAAFKDQMKAELLRGLVSE